MLKRIEMKGFKSFADKTIMDFESGVSCIVGPNGSGKSNITDALRWVLGEQSYKSLRGKHMTDVIFNGTVSRAPLGYAEVLLVIDNESKIIDLPYTEISILRRLYRSGESVYSINGNSCRLKDIKELFMDTGIGVEGYSIIGQGRIDKLLSSGKEDRRAIFEEASGIAKYKSKKEEAKRKLDKTSSHLERIEDIISELELRVVPLKEQSEKASKHLEIKNELKSVEISLYIDEIDKIKEELSIYEKDILVLEEESEKIAETLFKSKDEAGSLSLEIEDLNVNKRELSIRKNDLEKSKIEKEGYIKLLEERIALSKKRNSDLESEIIGLNESLNESKEKISSIKESLEESKLNYQEKEKDLNEIKSIFDKTSQNLDENLSKLALIKANKREYFDEINKIEIERAKYNAFLEQALEKDKILAKEIEVNESDKQGALEELKKIQQDLNEIEDNEKSHLENKSKIERSISEKRVEIDSIENQIYKLQSEKNEAISKRDILESRIENFEGMREPAREVLIKAKQDEYVYGTVASLIEIDKKYETALEQILGARSENIVTQDFDTAKKYIEFLKKNNLGRQSFLPIDDLRVNDIVDIDETEGYLGHAMDFIDCDERVEPAIRYLLYNVSFVEDLQSAKVAKDNAPNAYKIVTLDGEVVNVGGSVSGGRNKSKRNPIFSDKRELEAIKALISEDDKKLDEIKKNRENYIELLKGNLDELDELQKKIDELRFKKSSAEAYLDSGRRRLSGGVESEKKFLQEQEKNLQYIEELKKNIEESKVQESNLKNENEKSQINTEELNDLVEKFRLEISELSEKINSQKIELSRLEFDLKNKESEYKNQKDKLDKDSDELSRIENEKKHLLIQIEKNEEELVEKEKQITSIVENSEDTVKKLNEIDLRLSSLTERSRKDLETYRTLEDRMRELKDSMYGIRINTGKLETKLENKEQSLWEDYNLSYAGALDFKVDISYNKAKTLMRNYKRELEEIGEVNILAIEEYKEVNDRYEFMNSQKGDLKETLSKLNSLIFDMDTKMRKAFTESLENINEKFQQTFNDLFKGGMATIELAEDEDVLDAEIIINAQPPGKKLQTIELLSGGEKSLTAIAILFAILKTKPAPFCILDEIEAALDDRNITLFSSFLKDYKRDSQFILISHRKTTIKIADSIYGVTMKEKGISNVLSLKLNDDSENILSEVN